MTNNQLITPKELKESLVLLAKMYSKDYSQNIVDKPHYEHLTIGNRLMKVGYTPNLDNTPTLMSIRITQKGYADGK